MQAFLITLFIIFIIQLLFFLYAYINKTDKVTDLAYGATFIAIVLWKLITNGTYFPVQILVTALITNWGVRLAVYLFIRIHAMGKDKRFDEMREHFFRFAGFWTLQTIAIWTILLPALLILFANNNYSNALYSFIGTGVWFAGFLLETIADWQKFTFKKKHKDRWIESGVWKYSRYPNYFGEMLCWWGIFIIAVPFLSGWSWLVLIGPIFITILLLFVSGIPMLEKRYEKKYGSNPKYQAYKKRTNILIPWFPKNI